MSRQHHSHQQQQPEHQQEEQEEVNRIFSNNTIEQVAATCRQMQNEVKQTQLELRQMVGNRHRELIDCCGALVGIDQVCHEVRDLCTQITERRGHNSPLLYDRQQQLKDKSAAKKSTTTTAAAASLTSSAVATTTASAKQQAWYQQQMLHALRATQLIEEGHFLRAAVQVSNLEHDVALGARSSIASSSSSSSSAATGSSGGATTADDIPAFFRTLESTSRRLKDQWIIAASNALANLTHSSDLLQSQQQVDAANLVLASCFQGHGLLARAEPADALRHLLTELGPTALKRIQLQCSSTNNSNNNNSAAGEVALVRAARLLTLLSRFVTDLYRRGAHALINADTIDATAASIASSPTTLPPSALSAAAGLSVLLSPSSSAMSSFHGHSGGSVAAINDIVKLREEGRFASINSVGDAAAYLSQVATSVCALGVLDSAAPSSSLLGSGAKTTQKVIGGWASPTTGASPDFQSPASRTSAAAGSASQDQQQHLNLPSIEDCSKLFREVCCRVSFAAAMSSLVMRAADPAAGEALVADIMKENSEKLTSVSKGIAVTSKHNVKQLVQHLLQAIEEEVRQKIAAAAGACMLEHLSSSARKLLGAALGKKESVSAGKVTNAPLSESVFTATLALVSVVPMLSKDIPVLSSLSSSGNNNGSSSSSSNVTRNARAMLSSLVSNRAGRRSAAGPNASASSSTSTPTTTTTANATVAALTAQTAQYAAAALQRCSKVHDLRATQQITEIVRHLVEGMCAEARAFFEQHSISSGTSSSSDRASSMQAGIVAATCARMTCEPLLQLFSSQTSHASTSVTAEGKKNIGAAAATLEDLQAKVLKPWRSDALAEFQSECRALAAEESGAGDVGCSYTAPVLSGSWLLCRRKQQAGGEETMPCRPSPPMLAALIKTAHRVTSLMLVFPSTSSSSSFPSSSRNSDHSLTCPLHVRVELCAEICLWMLERAQKLVHDIVHATAIGSLGHPQQQQKEKEQRILQLYFDVMFAVSLLFQQPKPEDSDDKHQHQHHHFKDLMARVEARRKHFQDEIAQRVDGVVWAVCKMPLAASLTAALRETALVASPLTSVPFSLQPTSERSTSASSALPVSNMPPHALQQAVEKACERLPVLPLVSITPSATAGGASAAAAAAAGSSVAGAALAYGAAAGGRSGDAGHDVASGGNTATMGGAARELLAKGTAMTDKLKDVFKWF